MHVVLDFDDTLVDSAYHYDAWHEAFSAAGLDGELVHTVFVDHPDWTTERILHKLGVVDASEQERIVDHFRLLCADVLPDLIEGAVELLGRLTSEGHHLYLSTFSYEPRVKRILREHDLDHYFDLVLGGGDEHHKGAPHYETILAHSGLGSSFGEHAASLGDSGGEMGFARDHGVKLRIGFVPEGLDSAKAAWLLEAGATHLVTTLSDAADLIARDEELR